MLKIKFLKCIKEVESNFMNNNLLISFSGGETSAFMTLYLREKYKELGFDNICIVFANTGQENDATLKFVNECDKRFNLNVNWIEAKVIHDKRISTQYTIVNYETATRFEDWKEKDNTPFEQVIKKYGIPNQKFLHCTRELKENPIKHFGKDYFSGSKYTTAIGIRSDEFDRINENYKKNKFIYPLIKLNITKPDVNEFWSKMTFRLNLKGYQGNCITCWKKSDKKLFTIANENQKLFDFFKEMEEKYKFNKDGSKARFFRGNRTTLDILDQAKYFTQKITNDSINDYYQLSLESCEIFSYCEAK